ncbi:MAG: sigma-70 family RNA polymerase sigma factor [Clostridia bacterium]|nr:sigma-70 family RNA polymerase sigma factor [Clostridia bacterium]
MEDSEILGLLNRRDERAAELLFEKYGGLCRSIISNVLEDPRDVEECLNGVMFRLWSAIPPAQPGDLKAYAAKAARNEALMRARTLKPKQGLEIPLSEIESTLPAPEADSLGTAELISRFLKKQPPYKRDMFIRRYWYFYPIKDIAGEFSVSESKVTSLLFRMRDQLRTYLIKEGIFDG